MNFHERLSQAVDPEAFADPMLYERQRIARDRITQALGELSVEYAIIEKHRPINGPTLMTADYGADGKKLSLTKASLGAFAESLLRNGGQMLSTFVMRPDFPGSYVQAMVTVPEEAIEKVQTETGIIFERPAELKPASRDPFDDL